MSTECNVIIAGHNLVTLLHSEMDGGPLTILSDIENTIPALAFGEIVTDEQVEAFSNALCELNQSHVKPEVRASFRERDIELGLQEIERLDRNCDFEDLCASDWDYIVDLQYGSIWVYRDGVRTPPFKAVETQMITFQSKTYERLRRIIKRILDKRYSLNGACNYANEETDNLKASRILRNARKEEVKRFIASHGLRVELRDYWEGVCNDVYRVARGAPVIMQALLDGLTLPEKASA